MAAIVAQPDGAGNHFGVGEWLIERKNDSLLAKLVISLQKIKLVMEKFQPYRLTELRRFRSVSAAELARRLKVSVAQVHRLEKGERRLTVDMLMAYCDALELEVSQLFSRSTRISITGVVGTDYEVMPTPPDSIHQISLPPIIPDITRVAGLRWEPGGQISRMFGHVLLYYAHDQGIGENAWNNRCLIVRDDGTQCVGWPVNENDTIHIDNPEGRTQFSVGIRWASPILAVLPPFVVRMLQTP